MNWRWNVRRLALSAFLAFHLSMLAVINMPPSPIRQRLHWLMVHYMIPIGLDQSWGMFAPNPVMHSMALEVMTVDKDGIQRTFAFPKMTDFSTWRAIPRVRHSKFASLCGVQDKVAHREFAVHHAIRQLQIPASSFPIQAELLYQVRETPLLFEGPKDPLKPPVPQTLETYQFDSIDKVRP